MNKINNAKTNVKSFTSNTYGSLTTLPNGMASGMNGMTSSMPNMPVMKYDYGYIQDYLNRNKLPATKQEAICPKKGLFKNRRQSPVRISESNRVVKNAIHKLSSLGGKTDRTRSPNVEERYQHYDPHAVHE